MKKGLSFCVRPLLEAVCRGSCDPRLSALMRSRLRCWWEEAIAVDAEFCLNVSRIQPLPGACIRLQMVGDGLEVRLPLDSVGRHLRTLRRLMPRVYRDYPDPAYIDLRYSGQVVVGNKEAASG